MGLSADLLVTKSSVKSDAILHSFAALTGLSNLKSLLYFHRIPRLEAYCGLTGDRLSPRGFFFF